MLRCKPQTNLNASRRDELSMLRLKPLAQAIALLMVAGNAHAATAFSSAWFAAKGASQAGGAARPTTAQPGMPPPLAQQQRANAQLQRSLTNLNNTVAAIAAQQAAQAAGRQAALGQVQVVPDGLGEGGLKVDNSLTQGWLNAKGPQQTQAGGKTTVKIEQTADKAILNWETFNVGRNTTVDFQQQSDWAVLNRVNDPQARPSQIQGQVKGNGTVMLVNRNGIIFSGSSQVNVRNLAAVAANISDEQFSQRGLYVDATGSQPTFTDAAGKVEVQQGALIETHRAATSTAGGGYALLLGSEVENAGSIITAKGQTTLAAGDSFYIRRGQGTSGNLRSTARGNEVATSLKPGSSAGTVINSGLIQASTGDITLTGHTVQQNGVAVASSSVDTRGTVHLLNAASDSSGSVTLGQGSATAVLLDAAGGSALDSQRNAGPAGLDGTPNNLITGPFNNLSSVVDRSDQSRVEIVSGGSVDFQNGSITLATGGQVAVSAAGRSLVRDGAVIDVSGAIGVKVAMESNSIKVNVQGNEQRDAPVNRDGGKLTNNDVWVDVRDLIYVPAGTNGYATDRWYTAGGLLEVGGYLGTRGHSVGEWAAQGGTLTFTGNDVVTQQAAQLNLSGGTLDVQSGYLRQSWLKGPDGRLYELSKAPGDILYTGIYKGYEDHSQRWGQTDYYYNPLIAPRERFEAGYTVGRDAGKLVVSTRNAVLEGQIVGEVYQGERQTQAPNLNLDGYQQSQNAVARRAQLWVGSYTPIYDKTSGVINSGLTPTFDQVTVGKVIDKIAAGLDLTSAVGSDRQGKLVLDNALLNDFQLGAVKVAAAEGIKVDGALKVADGGDITLYTPQVEVNADLTARSGRIVLGNILKQVRTDNFQMGDVTLSPVTGQRATVTLGEGVKLNTAGRWSNLLLDGNDRQGLPFINGGSVSVRSSGDIDVRQGSLIDVSSGAAVMADGKTRGGKGGDLTLTASTGASSGNGDLNLEGELRGTGVSGGGTLKLAASKVLIGNSGTPLEAGTLQLDGDFFDKGFSAYDITGNEGLTVADGTRVDVTMPVYRVGEQALVTGSDAEPAAALQRWTPELYQEDAVKGVLTQRRGASLSLTAGTPNSSAADMASTVLSLGKGSVITVDPGQGIDVRSSGQLTANGTLNAWGGRVSLTELSVDDAVRDQVNAQGHGRSIWLGEQALIDVSSRAMTAQDMHGQTYGLVRDGGQIVIGGQIDAAKGSTSASELFVVVRDGARLQADGSQAVLDVAGQGRSLVASNGGSISMASANGLYLDGALSARSGGAGAAGGSLSVALETPYYLRSAVDGRVLNVRELVLEQVAQAHRLGDTAETSADSLVYGHGRLGVDQVQAGGFDNLSLLSNGLMSVDGNLSMSLRQSLSLYARSFGLSATAPANTRVEFNAPHVLLSTATGLTTTRPSFDPYTRPVIDGGGVSLLASKALFSVDADLLDVQGNVMFSSKGTVRQADGSTVALERAGFDQVRLSSRGDLRFLAGFSSADMPTGFTTQLLTPSDMLLQAAQLYPATGVGARVLAGSGWGISDNGTPLYDPARSLVIGRTTQTTPQVPYSAFGRLQLGSANIEQGGVVRAPLGLIEVGTNGSVGGYAISDRVSLLPGSLTSVSGLGLRLPYGGTVDGQSYEYAGKKVVLLGQGAVPGLSADVNIGVILGGRSVTAQEGSVLDLSGGGDLLGAGFISGRGGSTDARFNPLVQMGANGGFTLPGLSSNPVYAIVPGNQSQYAPVAAEGGAVDPRVGQQITIGAGVPGLAAGTYTLMPSTYALLPGAFRVEVNGLAGQGVTTGAQQMRNGSWTTAGVLSVANTGQHNSLSSQVILTSGDVLRRYSQYNETSYAQFAVADAARLGVPRAMLPVDAKTLKLNLAPGAGDQAFSFKGIGKFAPQAGGFGGSVSVVGYARSALEVVADGRGATAGFEGVTLTAESLNALNASRQVIGGLFSVSYGQSGNYVTPVFEMSRSVTLREGAALAAPEVFLLANGGELSMEQGAVINTIGRGAAAYDARDGFVYNLNNDANMLAASNGLLSVLAPPSGGAGSINIGGCRLTPCSGVTRIHSEGSIVAGTAGSLELDDQVRYGTRHLTLALSNINVGTAQALSDASGRNVLPVGLTLSQTVLDRLLRGDTQYGAPALETLELSASQALNFYGTVSLDTYDSTTGKSRLNNLMLSTPAIYGAGGAGDVATIRTANLIWNGAVGAPGSVIAGGAGTGAGRLDIQAQRIEFGYGEFAQPSSVTTLDRLALGFANVNLSASERLTANHKGSLAVYQSQGAYDAKTGYAYSGGNLNILTPLLTGEAGSVNRITAGGAVNVTGTTAKPGTVSGLGGELSLKGQRLNLASAVVLPSGKLTLSATDDLTLADEALIDVAGRAITFNDVTRYSAGGEVILQSRNGNIRQADGSSIDLSARNNQAGRLSAVALGEAAGLVDLQGRILGSSSGEYDAGGTAMPYLAGSVEIQAQRLGGTGSLSEQFAALNQRLNDGQVYGSRGFQLKQGDLVIGNELKASTISVSLDNGNLLVNGKVDASGERVGSIRLSAGHSLTLGSSAVLDAHGNRLRVDSYGKIIDSPNRATVDLTSRAGVLTLSDGARIDLRHGTAAPAGQHDGRARGTLELNARRAGPNATLGDIAIDASGNLDIQGARSIAVNGMWRYNDADYGSDPAASGRPYQVIDQAYLDRKHQDSTDFINAALDNDDLMQRKLAGLNNARYADAFHLRPGVEIVSATADGDLVVQGDLDLSGFRYASVNPHTQKTAVYGSGEAGALTLRAGGDLSIYGSINDGFAPPPATQDDKGWVLLPGIDFTGGDIIVPGAGVTLAEGTAFPAGTTLNYDLPIKGVTLAAGTRLPVAAILEQPLELPAGTVLAAAVHDASGNLLFAAGTLLNQAQTLQAGSQLGAGSVLSRPTALLGFTWPKGVALPNVANVGNVQSNILRLDRSLALNRGSLIPSGTDVKLPDGVESIQLRPEIAGSQGRMWAVAPMLAEGSQSWSLRLVAGADTAAADSRIVQPEPLHGDLRLADSHYGMFGKPVPAKGVFLWTEAGVAELLNAGVTVELGAPIDQEIVGAFGYASVDAFCADLPFMCALQSSYKWTEAAVEALAGSGYDVKAGAPIDASAAQFFGFDSVQALCEYAPEMCAALGVDYKLVAGSTRPSVIRTGTGDLELLSGGSLRMDTLFGIYTAGTSSTPTFPGDPYNQPKALGANGKVLNDENGSYEKLVDGGAESIYRAWYPDAGGNLLLKVGGDLSGNLTAPASAFGRPNPADIDQDSANVGNWLWRQGDGDSVNGQSTAWWINFGSYTASTVLGGADQMAGFTGFGTLGGGDLDVQVGGDAGVLGRLAGNDFNTNINPRSQGLLLAVGSTGRVGGDGSLQLTGGGDLNLQVGGALNPESLFVNGHLNGAVINLRGHAQIDSGAIGRIDLQYGNATSAQSPGETRAYDSFKSTRGLAAGGLTLMPGDATFDLTTSGDLVVMDVADPGRAPMMSASRFKDGDSNGSGLSWFTLWTANTAIDLWSSGGNLTPFTSSTATDLAVVYPSILRAVAASGSLYYGKSSAVYDAGYSGNNRPALLLAPGINSELQFMAGDSIYGGDMSVSRSGAASTALATPFRPAYVASIDGGITIRVSNLSADGNPVRLSSNMLPLFAFDTSSASSEWALNADPARFYALEGDLLAVTTGRSMTSVSTARWPGRIAYEGAGAVRMMAGRDIVSSGVPLAGSRSDDNNEVGDYTSTGNLFIHNNPTDISIVSAGRDILYSNFNVAGPGLLEITAGRNILMDDKVSITSLGAVVPGDSRPGASLVLQAGAGLNGADYERFVKAYLDPANQALAGVPLANQDGKVAKTYEAELVDWLKERFGFSGDSEQARSYFAALPAEQQRVFARDVYFAELKAGGREYNEVGGVRQGSYLRGREAIDLLYPTKDVAGNPITYKGDITMFGGAGVHTDFGGSIQMLTPGGGQTFGIEGNAPPSTAGVITQGEGDIQLYAQNSILLGQSRIMTTFGGSILGWSAQGDINAGRGSKTTVVYTPPKRLYDTWGNVTLSPSVPSTGAGIATLNPIAEVAPGDIDLIAPLGTIDASEAGIRVSGNVNIAALTVVNAANIQTQGKSTGVPLAASVNTGAITSASSAASSATQAAEDVARQQQNAARQNQASVFTVQVVSFGSEQLAPSRDGANRDAPRAYDPASPVQVLGAGPLDEQNRQRLTEEERGRLSL
ncbi:MULTISPECIES: filamentous hemagglutinin family protein [unclassified Pseudomonas]|uniref:filamentous hemagglutinin family protein n=1 Tax=unclassified Pseudomonas TaxID=196821 RepID=UPI000871836F|nr:MULTISPECIES: filamentous hemagglutinin family protein [unclassified Pseudomonas]SCW70131.1 filamentous hemagglutinin family N-terminal domain-containing protein [Pseudomonas sp. NFACC56-3]SFK35087.1 filamentous hemagglutinin family N-terminal domain-containing protein [Pseudomonas sp. NFACC52]